MEQTTEQRAAAIADDFAGNWTNGNRKDAVDIIADATALEAFVAGLTVVLHARNDSEIEDVLTRFARMADQLAE